MDTNISLLISVVGFSGFTRQRDTFHKSCTIPWWNKFTCRSQLHHSCPSPIQRQSATIVGLHAATRVVLYTIPASRWYVYCLKSTGEKIMYPLKF